MNLLLREVALATERLAEAGVPAPRFDAEELAAYVHQVDRGRLHTVPDAEFDAAYWAAIARRAAREPLQHITGRAYFRYRELAVGPGVFIPRPETEVVVGWAIDRLSRMDVAEPLVVDLCAGSAAIALAIAQEVPRARVHAVELDDAAFGWARRNVDAAEQSLARRITLHHADVNGCLPELNGRVDLVISNPPYVPLGASVRDPEVAEYDPARALWAGADGLDVIRTVERVAAGLLRPDGWVVVEHADEQWAEAPRCFPEEAGWTEVRDHRDLADRPRFVTARKEASPL
ncbi:MAG TPA: peptide chain release factor N(5)-glutamine methyltransferase [Actinomycetes bacterium]|nr:peptide chain release factor N(5)-glutamine methyltransferase [Actinomycetes bacterium]